jgi:soluble lytic murein transglycosylase-like protein
MSINAIDPKLITAWLRTQFVSPSELASASLGTSKPNAGEGGTDFSVLLQLLSASNGNGTTVPPTVNSGAKGPHSLQALASGSPLAFSSLSAVTGGREAPADLERVIQQASEKYGVEASLVKAVIQAESGFNPKAESHAGAKGLMQLMDATAKSLGVTDAFDPVQNINGGTRFLSYLLTKYNGNEGVALAAYNAGPGRVDRLGIRSDADLSSAMDRLPKETQAYVRKVLGYKEA